jgi:hypothetical protein
MKYKKRSIEEKEIDKEARENSIDRLFNNQRINLEMLSHYIVREDIYDKNDRYNLIQEIISINLVISKKLKNEKR